MKFLLKKSFFSFLIILGGLFFFSFPIDFEGKTINKITVKGNENIKPEQIIAYFDIKKNDKYNTKEIQKNFKKIFQAGFLQNIKIDVTENSQGELDIAFIVVENLRIGKIFFVGNAGLTSVQIEEQLSIKKFAYFESSLVNESRFTIMREYIQKGYLDIEVDYVTEKNPNTEDEVNITFLIREGARYLVKGINFIGNTNIHSKILEKTMSLKLDSFFSSGYFDPYRLQVDRDKIEHSLRDNGYYKGKISDVSLTYAWKEDSNKKDKDVFINITLEEGEEYFFGELKIKGNTLFSLEELFFNFKRKTGETFSQSIHDNDIKSIYRQYQDNGYIFVRITPIETIDKDFNIDYLLDIYEGDKAHIENIFIQGLTKTKKKVVLRELKIAEGEIFDVDNIRDSLFNLNRLGFFGKIDTDYRTGSTEGLMNLIFLLKDKNTGFINGGFTYSFSTGFALTVEVKEKNFLGLAHQIAVKANIGLVLKDLNFSYVEPWLLGQPISLGGSLVISKKYINYYINKNNRKNPGGYTTVTSPDGGSRGYVNHYSDAIHYTQDKLDIGIFSGQRFFDWWSINEGFSVIWIREYLQKFKLWPEKYNQYEIYQYNKDLFNTPPPIDSSLIALKLNLSITYDSRDNILSPSTGVFSSLSTELYFIDYSLIIWSFNTGAYKSIAWRANAFPSLLWKLTFAYKFTFRTLGDSLIGDYKSSSSLNFSLKNTNVRGWEYDNVLSYYRGIGGNGLLIDGKPYGQSIFYQNFEILQNFGFDLLQLVYFFDIGNISNKKFSISDGHTWNLLFDWKEFLYSTGFGFKLNFAQFPVRLFFAWRMVYDDRRGILISFENPSYSAESGLRKPTIIFDVQGRF